MKQWSSYVQNMDNAFHSVHLQTPWVIYFHISSCISSDRGCSHRKIDNYNINIVINNNDSDNKNNHKDKK